MMQRPTCILREEENRWTGRVYEQALEDGALQYTYTVIAPLRYEAGHALAVISDPAVSKTYRVLVEVETAMRHELHERATGQLS